jgi:PEP-CTERM/exosortase A-associated glycosyltransferase
MAIAMLMPNILHVLDHSLPLHSGYTFRTRAIMTAQKAAGWDVFGITGVRQYQNGETRNGSSQTEDGLTFYRTEAKVDSPSPLRELHEVSALCDAIIAQHHKTPFDLLHAHSPALNGLAAVRAGALLGLPVVYEIRAFWEDAAVGNGSGSEGSVKYRLTRALENHVIRRADAIAVICEGLRSDLVSRGVNADKIIVSPNGVDMQMFGKALPYDTALAAELGLTGKDIIGYIGSFYDYEGLDDLVSAMPFLSGEGRDANLLMVGGGPMAGALQAQVDQSPCRDRIHFVGRVPHDQVDRYYSLIDILAYPRKKMRLTDLVTPLKPLEAMAQMRLVAASDVGGHQELIRDGDTGTLFPADDPQGIASALDGLFAKRGDWDAMRDRARKFVASERDWQQNIYRYDPVYHLLLSRSDNEKVALSAA